MALFLVVRLGPSYSRYLVGPPALLFVDFYPRESHLITFRDPSSFLVLYNPSCNDLVARHLRALASKVRAFPGMRETKPLVG